MNYLAHIYLSGDNELLTVGNFIGDYVKGKQHEKYDTEVQRGILLHRQIDFFTDQHPIVKKVMAYFRPNYGRYAGIVTDMIFDYFLAVNWSNYSSISLRNYSKNTHAILLSNFSILPARVKLFLPFIIQHKRFESYATLEGIQESLEIMSRRTSLPAETAFAMQSLKANYQEIKEYFEEFFEELISYVEDSLGMEIKKPA